MGFGKKLSDSSVAQKNPKRELGRGERIWLFNHSTLPFCSVSLVHFPHSSTLMTTLKAGYLGCSLHFSNPSIHITHFPFTSMGKGKTRVIHQSAPPELRVVTHPVAHFLGDAALAVG